jgi:hypothetical protein
VQIFRRGQIGNPLSYMPGGGSVIGHVVTPE